MKRRATQSTSECVSLGARRAGALAAVLAMSIACGEESDEVSFARDVKPVLDLRCVPCHHSENTLEMADLEDPFSVDETPGLINVQSPWPDAPLNVVPYEPDQSFIMEKVTNLELRPDACDVVAEDCRREKFGEFMPKTQRLTEAELDAVRQWIQNGALEAEWGSLSRIIGTTENAYRAEKCIFCHYPGSPDPPDLTQPYDPVNGIVGVRSSYRADMLRVEPGNPEGSLLFKKLEAGVYGMPGSSEFGSPMPRNYEPLSDHQVDLLRRWILAGAPNN